MRKKTGFIQTAVFITLTILIIAIVGALILQKGQIYFSTTPPYFTFDTSSLPTVQPKITGFTCKTSADCPPVTGMWCSGGNRYECENNLCVYYGCPEKASATPKTITVTGSKDCISDSDCILAEKDVCELGRCESCKLIDYSSDLIEAYSAKWCHSNQPNPKPCPLCDPQKANKDNLVAKCINRTCVKTK